MVAENLMHADDNDVELLLHHMDGCIGIDSHRWYSPDGYRSVALAILDSIYSTGNGYTGVTRLVANSVALREAQGANAWRDTASDLVGAVERCGGVLTFVELTDYRWRTYASKTAPYKGQVAYEAAQLLAEEGLETVDDIRRVFTDRAARMEAPAAKKWLQLKSQGSGLTWNYFLMLMGIPGVKADRMVTRFVSRAVGRTVGMSEASLLIESACDRRGWNYTTVDHTIWRYQSGRPHLQAVDLPTVDR